MYKLVHKSLINTNLITKIIGVQENYSYGYTIVQLIDQINISFENNHFSLDVFIHLIKAVDTADHIKLTN